VTDLTEQLRTALSGRYTIERELGRGGMATVWLARDLRHDRLIALKVLHPELSASLGPERFLREIRTTARLDHPHILALLDSGEVAGPEAAGAAGGAILWYTMPYVEGESLRDRLRREGQLPVEQALRIGAEVADALDCAHEHNIVHRDIKPENILLSRGHARVADFGVARALEAAGGSELTATGLAVGTPTYMSPEQASGGAVDPRTDVYALGCVLYEMLAGEPPFTGPTAQAIVAKRFAGEPTPLRVVRPSVPETVEQAVCRALAPVPADRFASAAELGRALETAVSGATPSAGRPSVPTVPAAAAAGRGRRRIPVLAATLAVGFVLGLGVLFGWLRGHGGAGGDGGLKRVAVLPFENLGQADDEYFADGLADAVRGKLAALPNLQVAARASSAQYKRTPKSPQQIGRELGVEYLLTGTVRWEKGTTGQGRVQVSPELVQVSTASTRWQEPFDAALTDVFQVQADVATRVAQALGVALSSGERARISARPTANLAAYDLYLRGKDYYNRGYDRENYHTARQMLERAVGLDSAFAEAWAQLSIVRAAEYWFFYNRTEAAVVAAKAAADRAMRLRPDLADSHLALGYYWYWARLDYDQALGELETALAARPNDADVSFAIGVVRRRQGKWQEALASMSRAVELDPRSQTDLLNLGETYWLLRDFPRALEKLAGVSVLAPDWARGSMLRAAVMVSSGQPVDSARVFLHGTAERFGLQALAREAMRNFNIVEPTFLLSADPAFRDEIEAFTLAGFADTIGYYKIKSELNRAARRPALERAYLDSSRAVLETKVREQPGEPAFHALLGIVYAYLGSADAAIREGETATRLMPISREAYKGGSLLAAQALIESRAGRPDAAVKKLEYLLAVPSVISPPLLWQDPAWNALRTHPGFRRLMEAR
jgi:serine/threonine-protein kinase